MGRVWLQLLEHSLGFPKLTSPVAGSLALKYD